MILKSAELISKLYSVTSIQIPKTIGQLSFFLIELQKRAEINQDPKVEQL